MNNQPPQQVIQNNKPSQQVIQNNQLPQQIIQTQLVMNQPVNRGQYVESRAQLNYNQINNTTKQNGFVA